MEFNEKVQSYLEQLVGKKVCDIGRASNMLWIVFDEMISLHVQTMWRIVNKEEQEILLAYSDFYSPNSKLLEKKDFKWDVQGNNLFDEKAGNWLKTVETVSVNEYKINRWGDLLLVFSNGERLEIFVDASDDTECWRLFKHDSDEAHLVVTGFGVSCK